MDPGVGDRGRRSPVQHLDQTNWVRLQNFVLYVC
jgi:hypothetical protein